MVTIWILSAAVIVFVVMMLAALNYPDDSEGRALAREFVWTDDPVPPRQHHEQCYLYGDGSDPAWTHFGRCRTSQGQELDTRVAERRQGEEVIHGVNFLLLLTEDNNDRIALNRRIGERRRELQ